MAALDLLGRRWALRILWELRQGPLGARALRVRCDEMSTSVLYERLAELGDADLVAQGEDGYLRPHPARASARRGHRSVAALVRTLGGSVAASATRTTPPADTLSRERLRASRPGVPVRRAAP